MRKLVARPHAPLFVPQQAPRLPPKQFIGTSMAPVLDVWSPGVLTVTDVELGNDANGVATRADVYCAPATARDVRSTAVVCSRVACRQHA